jgi:hypothetical protein
MSGRIQTWLSDPFLRELHDAVRAAGPIRSISVDLTHACNIRCEGCYFFAEGMDAHRAASHADLDEFIVRERARGTNFVTVVGGEPSMELDRLKKLYDTFRLSVATNGLKRIPHEGFEDLPIGVSVWGDHETDKKLRGGGRLDVFEQALRNYAGDPRAFFYYTVAPGYANEVESVVARCVENGNRVLFNFYGDLEHRGGRLDYAQGFGAVRDAIDAAIARHPEHVLMTSRLAEVVSTGELFGETWGHSTCTSITADHPVNAERILNGNAYNPHFRSYNADLVTTRRCCTGVDRDCDSCFDTWQHFSWVMLNLRKHCRSQADFTQWLSTMYLFYFVNRLIDCTEGGRVLREIHHRTGRLSSKIKS